MPAADSIANFLRGSAIAQCERRRRTRPTAATASNPSDAGSGAASVTTKLSKISALKSWLLAVEFPVRPVSSLPSETFPPPNVTAESGDVVIALPSIDHVTFVPSLAIVHVCQANPCVPAAVLPLWVDEKVDCPAGALTEGKRLT